MSLPDQLIGRPETQEQLRKLVALFSGVERVHGRERESKGHELAFYFTDLLIRDLLNFSRQIGQEGARGLE